MKRAQALGGKPDSLEPNSLEPHKLEAKTNAARMLENLGIAYQPRSYQFDLDDLSARSVAHKLGLPPGQIFKTLLTEATTGGYFFAVVPGDRELDLKKMAAVVGVKKLELASLKQVEPLTGYLRGAVTVLAAKKNFPAFVDESICGFNSISVSGGRRGLQFILNPQDYLRACSAVVVALTRSAPADAKSAERS